MKVELDLGDAVLAIVVCIAVGVLAMDMAVEIRAHKPVPRVEVKPAERIVPDPRLICEHHKLTGRDYLCKTS